MNELSLNEDKTRFALFHRPQNRDNLIYDYKIKQSSSIKFLGILVDEHLSWIENINILGNKL